MRLARPALPIVAVLVGLAALLAGCGFTDDSSHETGSGESSGTSTAPVPVEAAGAAAQSCEGVVAGAEQLRITGAGCDVGRGIVAAWVDKPACARPTGASRYSCTVYRGYRCQGVATERGIAVSCSRPDSSLAFVAKRG